MDARGWIEAWGRDDAAEAVDADIRAELEAHLALSEEALRAEGRTQDEAWAEARARFGDLEGTLRACRRVRLGGRVMLVRIQWLLIALLLLSTVAMALYARDRAVRAHMEREHAMAEALNARAMLAELGQRNAPVDVIVIALGDRLTVQNDTGSLTPFTTEVQRDGQALFAGLGWIEVAGMTRPDLERLLSERYENDAPIYVIVKSPK